jgi:4a-hydroxytetrahydrobiopterin dehydratase
VISGDAIYRDEEGTAHVVEWVTRNDIELARRISEIAAEQGVRADPAPISTIEIALDTANAERIAPMWAALLTGTTDSVAGGVIVDDSHAPWFTVLADHDGNRACVCTS